MRSECVGVRKLENKNDLTMKSTYKRKANSVSSDCRKI